MTKSRVHVELQAGLSLVALWPGKPMLVIYGYLTIPGHVKKEVWTQQLSEEALAVRCIVQHKTQK